MHESLMHDRMYVAADIMIMTVRSGQLCLLLSRRTADPFAGCCALPGRLVDLGESVEETAHRLLKEMLPVRQVYLEQLYTFSDVGRDPRGRVISAAYLIVVPWLHLEPVLARGGSPLMLCEVKDGGDGIVLTAQDGSRIESGSLAFDHGRIIETGVARLRGKIDYTSIGFRFLGNVQAFTLSELQAVFEAVLGRPVDASNFRRGILARYEAAGKIEQLDRAEKRKRGRPAALYRFIHD